MMAEHPRACHCADCLPGREVVQQPAPALEHDQARRVFSSDVRCPFCGARMQYAESGRYAEWTCLGDACQGHADVPLAWQYREPVAAPSVECTSPDGRWHRRPDGVWEPSFWSSAVFRALGSGPDEVRAT